MTQDQTTTDTTADRADEFERRVRERLVGDGAELTALASARVVFEDMAIAQDAEIGRLRAEKSAILTDTGRDFTRLFHALGMVEETDMTEAVEEAARIYDEQHRLREELAGLKAAVPEFANALSEALLNQRDKVWNLRTGSRCGGLEEAAGMARAMAESWSAPAVDGGGETRHSREGEAWEIRCPACLTRVPVHGVDIFNVAGHIVDDVYCIGSGTLVDSSARPVPSASEIAAADELSALTQEMGLPVPAPTEEPGETTDERIAMNTTAIKAVENTVEALHEDGTIYVDNDECDVLAGELVDAIRGMTNADDAQRVRDALRAAMYEQHEKGLVTDPEAYKAIADVVIAALTAPARPASTDPHPAREWGYRYVDTPLVYVPVAIEAQAREKAVAELSVEVIYRDPGEAEWTVVEDHPAPTEEPAFNVGDVVRGKHTGNVLTVVEPVENWLPFYYELVRPAPPPQENSEASDGE